jgi:DNA-binding transcriptional MerR regulator
MTTISGMDMTIGQFSALTGLTQKALRLYDERGLLVPAVVDPVSGYRWYSTDQVRHGHLLAALRSAGVPMSELTDLDGFDIDRYRERQQLRRLHEDTALSLADAVKGISLTEWPVTAVAAAELPWVGTIIGMDLPEDGEFGAWLQMALSLPQVQAILGDALDAYGNRAQGPCWTTNRASSPTHLDLLVCHPARHDQRQTDWDGFADHIDRRLPRADVEVLAGVLPPRIEVTCAVQLPEGDRATSMASSYAPYMAIDEYIKAHALRPLDGAARDLLPTGPDEDEATTTVRDVELQT